jgi:hypothetical protein
MRLLFKCDVEGGSSRGLGASSSRAGACWWGCEVKDVRDG